ncbi:AraC family transcriptional regulator [Prolixibacteraceae bacterium JC049]|nr:AraC family transcriptional regulator [Prolixibacteraceae bacterium JC049]
MSYYTLFNEELEEIIAGRYFNDEIASSEYSSDKRTVFEDFGTFQYSVANYNRICISENRFSLNEDIKMHGSIEGEIICLTFMNQGNSQFSCNSFQSCNIDQNTCNLFYLNNEKRSETAVEQNSTNNLLEIYLAKDFLVELCEKYPAIFHGIYHKIYRQESFALFENSRFLTPQIQEVLHQIKNAEILGNVAPLLVEAKIMELFTLLVDNSQSSYQSEIKRSTQNKIYEAKAIIENKYQKPPSIDELSRELGICSTSLKEGFKKTFKSTLYGYLFDFRMMKAEHMLKSNSELDLLDVALKVGYEHQANFSAAFKRKYGITPLQFKKNYLSK